MDTPGDEPAVHGEDGAGGNNEPTPPGAAPTLEPELDPDDVPAAPELDVEFRQFYVEHLPVLVSILLWHGASSTDALDCAHEAMVKACDHWEVLYRPAAWCRTTALRIYWALRNEQRREALARAEHPFPDEDGTAAETLDDIVTRHSLLDLARRHLSLQQSRVVALTYDGATPAEIATEIGVTAATVRSTLRTARQVLRDAVGKGEL